MGPEGIVDLFRSAIYLSTLMVCVITLPSLIVGLLVSMFQAATQINEQTLSFLPRLIVTMLTLVLAGPWLARAIQEFTQKLVSELPNYIG